MAPLETPVFIHVKPNSGCDVTCRHEHYQLIFAVFILAVVYWDCPRHFCNCIYTHITACGLYVVLTIAQQCCSATYFNHFCDAFRLLPSAGSQTGSERRDDILAALHSYIAENDLFDAHSPGTVLCDAQLQVLSSCLISSHS